MIRKIIFSGLTFQPLLTLLNITLFGFGVAIISLILVLNHTYNKKIEKDLKNIDLVVGAKGSPLQLVLSSVYQIDQSTGKIPLNEISTLKSYPQIKSITPIYFEDHYNRFRILGTDHSYLKRYQASLHQGSIFKDTNEVVLGFIAASRTGLRVGDHFTGTQGSGESAKTYIDHPYKVVGILNRTGSVIDQLIVCSLETVINIHQPSTLSNGKSNQISAFLIELNDPAAIFTLPKKINQIGFLQTAIPRREINKLSHLTGMGTTLLEGIAWSIIFISALSIFVVVYRRVRDRRYELAIMRLVGATRLKLLEIILFEAWVTITIGYILGLAASRFGIWLLQNKMLRNYPLSISYQLTPNEKLIFPVLLLIGTLSVILPLIYVFRLNISKILAKD